MTDEHKDERYTPRELTELAHRLLEHVDLDPCTTYEVNRKGINARQWFGVSQDGLKQIWTGRTFVNPPGSKKKEFAHKLANSLDLLPAAIWLEYNWDHSTEALNVLLDKKPIVALLRKRVKFSGYEVGRSQAFLIWGVPVSLVRSVMGGNATILECYRG